jgi:hypothetical protein
MKKAGIYFLVISIAGLLFTSCAGPRAIYQSAKATPHKNLVIGGSMTANISTEATYYAGKLIADNIEKIASQDSIFTDENFESVNKAALAYAVDPIGIGYDIYARYGLVNRTEIGIKRAGRATELEGQFQFLGPTGNVDDITEQRFYGSVGIQYSWQKYDLPGYLGKLQDRLGFEFRRKDILVPLVFTASFGNEETYGSFSFGGVYSHTFLKYAGYKFLYIRPAFAVYYQNYGEYPLFNGKSASFKGLTFVPSISLQGRIGKSKKKEKGMF